MKLSINDQILMFIKSPRGKAILKLLVFFLVILLIRTLALKYREDPNDYLPEPVEQSSIKNEKSYEDYLGELKKANYGFTFKKIDGNQEYLIFGEKKNNEISGYVGSITGSKFMISNNQVYNTTNNNKVLDNQILSEYNYLFFDAQYLLTLIDSIEPILSSINNKTIYTYNTTEQIIAITYYKGIKEINIKFNNLNIVYTVAYNINK